MILAGSHAGADRPGPLPDGGGGHRPPAAPEHRAGLRGRRARGQAVLLAGVLRRRQPGEEAQRHAVAAEGGGGAGGDAGAGDAGGARAARHPSRPEAGQRAAGRGRHAEDHRLRAGEEARRGRSDAVGRHHGHAVVHGAGAGRRQVGRDRPGGGRVCAGGDPVRVPDGPAAVQGGDGAGHDHAGGERRAGAAVAVANEDAARPGDDLPEVPAQGGTQALRVSAGVGGRPAALPQRASRSGAAGGPGGAGGEVGEAQSVGDGAGGLGGAVGTGRGERYRREIPGCKEAGRHCEGANRDCTAANRLCQATRRHRAGQSPGSLGRAARPRCRVDTGPGRCGGGTQGEGSRGISAGHR